MEQDIPGFSQVNMIQKYSIKIMEINNKSFNENII